MEIKEIGKNNAKVTEAAKLLQKKHRVQQGRFLTEGKKLAFEAIKAGMRAQEVYFDRSLLSSLPELCEKITDGFGGDTEYYCADSDIIKKISGEESPEGIICVFLRIDKSKNSDRIYNINSIYQTENGAGVILLDSMRDPGNLGTVIRTACAFGTDELIISPDCADLYSPKVLRGSMGAAFSQSVTVMDTAEAISALHSNGYRVYAAALHRDALVIGKTRFDGKCCFVIGNEANGLSESVISMCDGCVFIPISDRSESLNAAVAASLIMWESVKNKN